MLQKNVRRVPGHLDQSLGRRIGILNYMDCVRGPEFKPQSIDMFSQFRFYRTQDYSWIQDFEADFPESQPQNTELGR